MLQIYKDRSVSEGEKVKVYFNLHTHLFSMLAMEGKHKGKVVAHGNGIEIENVVFHINKSGQLRVREQQKRNVHAYAVGTFKGITQTELEGKAYYNPYLTDKFINLDTKLELDGVEVAVLKDKRITYV
ncbi:hypothetical protein [Bacillus cereus]|uniref:hypothetical protein n=1 Tax=Bacillus cereus TaxID=1396 RepID=UPI000B4B93EE|nr:hypothetical protein [Bacillus cereus]